MAATAFLLNNTSPLILPNEPFQGTYGANGRINARLPVGPTYERLFFHFTVGGVDATAAEIRAGVDLVRIIVDADNKIELTGNELIYLDLYYQTKMTGSPAGHRLGHVGQQQLQRGGAVHRRQHHRPRRSLA